MLSHITTRNVLAVTTLTGIIAIAHTITSHGSNTSATELGLEPLTTSAVASAANAGSAPMHPMQLAVSLEGFDWQAPLPPQNQPKRG
ncbi:hypothetical protein EOS_05275 [Caballeronia mineralivorans PML1(12)]|uniref:Uncharacterized protein n=1 Tax=Caballeronia mineralivorans PML1(12) TaxID=908627 RepID=A0A0J1D3F7_9BURK|nr:hypothetical protein [Caballeronia mineralivorans]KLU27267.1 hypothetical protein EOS_05275 [Caballeronia mineralivorans PML1(12)]